jgi:predicted MPP superfamily phosphohydrolase
MLKVLGIYLIVTILLSIYLSYHFYKTFFYQYNKIWIIILLTVILVAILVSFIFIRNLPHFLIKPSQSIVFILMVGFLYLVVFYFILDFCRIFISLSASKESIIAFSLTIAFVILGYINTRFIRENYYTMISDKIKHPVKLIVISDLHIGSLDMTFSKMEKMVKQINAHQPDLVLIAGDIVDNASVNLKKLGYIPYFKQLHSTYGTFISIGNHEYYNGSVQNIINTLNKIPHTFVLNNKKHYFRNLNLNIMALSDKGYHKERLKNLADFQLNNEHFNLLVEHNPIYFKDNIKYPLDLQLSGHTHAGQIFIGYLIELLIYEKPWGKLIKDHKTLITTSGVGSWGPPIRDFNYPEIIIIDLKKAL